MSGTRWDGDDGEVVIHTDGGPVVDAMEGLGLIVKFDGLRKFNRWTVAIPGVCSGHGESPAKAAASVRSYLVALRTETSR